MFDFFKAYNLDCDFNGTSCKQTEVMLESVWPSAVKIRFTYTDMLVSQTQELFSLFRTAETKDSYRLKFKIKNGFMIATNINL